MYKMGQLVMYDLFMSHYNMYDFDLFTLDDVDAAFDRIIQLKYNQSVAMKGKGFGISLTLTPLPAGHLIGGTIWKIMKEGEEEIVYATDFNHKKERHLNGCELDKLQRPSLLITDCYNARYQQARRRARDEKLMTNILATLRSTGNVLITVDTAGRVLELTHMLDQLWKNKESGLMAYSLALLSNVSYNVIEFAKSQIEWMSDKLMKSFEGARNNPFQFKHVRLCHTMADLAKVPSPKVVLASSVDMESGFSRELFVMWAANPNNSIIITSRSSPGTLARDLIDNGGGGRKIELEHSKRVELEGTELDEYVRTHGTKVPKSIIKKERDVDTSDSDSDSDLEMNVITGKHDIVVRAGKSQTGFFKSSKKQYAMFPFHEEKIKYDDYGEIIQVDDYRMMDAGDGLVEDLSAYTIKQEKIKKEEKGKLEEDVLLVEKPTKCISSRKLIEVNAQVHFIDFEGRSDGDSLLKILSQLRPRRVIVVRGSPKNTEVVAEHCRQNIGARVFTPAKGETIDATTESHIYQVRLTEALVSNLKFQKAKDTEVAWINGIITVRTKQFESQQNEENMETDQTEQDVVVEPESTKILTLEPIDEDDMPSHDAVFINELKLSDFKQILSRNNIQSEFSDGVLMCADDQVMIKRVDSGRLAMEGCVCEEYYKIRKLLYEQFAIL